MSPQPLWSAIARPIVLRDRLCSFPSLNRVVLCRACIGRQAPFGTKSSNNPAKTDHILSTLKYAEPGLSKFTNYSQNFNLFADLFSAGNALSSSRHRRSEKAKVVVYGLDDSSAVRDLVSIFLDDPLSSNGEQTKRVQERWSNLNESSLTFQYGQEISASAENAVFLPSPYLSQLPVELVELRGSSPEIIHAANIPILVVNPNINSSPNVNFAHVLPPSPHATIIVNSSAGPASAARLEAEIRNFLHHAMAGGDVPLPRILFIDIERALRALDILRNNPTSTVEIQKYQSDFLASGFSTLISTLQNTLEVDPERLKEDTARALATSVIVRGHQSLRKARKETSQVYEMVDDLNNKITHGEASFFKEILGSQEGDTSLVSTAVVRATKDMQTTMDKLSWWKLPVIVDDLSQTISSAVEKSYSRELQNQLVFHTGRLEDKQSVFRTLTYTSLSSIPPSFRSSVLDNSLAQLSASPSYPVSPSSLLQPLHSRLAQLRFSTNQLHISAQRAVLTTFVGSFSSIAGTFALWFVSYMDSATAFGAGALSTAIILRWAIGRWDRARRRWWKDWRRVGEGLERDVRKSLSTVLSDQVFAVPSEAYKGLEALAEKRRKSLDAMDEELRKLRALVKPKIPPASRED